MIQYFFFFSILHIKSDLTWMVKNSSDYQTLDGVKIVGNTIEINMLLADHFNGLKNSSLKLIWTPQRQTIAVDIELNFENKKQLPLINYLLKHYKKPETEIEPMYGQISMLSIIDDVFPDEPFFSAANLSTIIREGMNLRQSLCYHWFMYYRINHTKVERLICHRVTDFCNLIAHFVRLNQLFRLPNYCLSCNENKKSGKGQIKFGARLQEETFDWAEVIFLLNGACNQRSAPKASLRFILQLNRLSKAIEKEFRMRRIHARFKV